MEVVQRDGWLESAESGGARGGEAPLTVVLHAPRRAGRGESRPYSDLSVPFGRIVVTDPFCTVISVPSEISTPTYASPTFVTLPTMPPFVTTSSPFAIAASMLRCSFWRFICGRIMMKYNTANIRISGRKLMMLDSAPAPPCPKAFEKNDP